MCTTDDEVCRLQNMFCKIKYIVFKIIILTVSLLCHSFGNTTNPLTWKSVLILLLKGFILFLYICHCRLIQHQIYFQYCSRFTQNMSVFFSRLSSLISKST